MTDRNSPQPCEPRSSVISDEIIKNGAQKFHSTRPFVNLRGDLESYDSRAFDYAKHKRHLFSTLEDVASPQLQQEAAFEPSNPLLRMLETERNRRVTTVIQQQEADLLKVVLKPSETNAKTKSEGPLKADSYSTGISSKGDAPANGSSAPNANKPEGKTSVSSLPRNSQKLPGPDTKSGPRAHYVGSEDAFMNSRVSSDDTPITTDPPPPVSLRPLSATAKKIDNAEVSGKKPSQKVRDASAVIYDDYDEKELPPLPDDFGPVNGQREAKIALDVVNYKEIFAKCYRNARRKTRVVLDKEPTTITVADLVDSKMGYLAKSTSWEPLVQEWLALATDIQNGILNDVDYENLIPVLFLGLEEVLLQAEKRGLIRQAGDFPVDDAGMMDDPNFDPLELLGAFLIRNNPKDCNWWETHSYVRSFRRIVTDIRIEHSRIRRQGDIARLQHQMENTKQWPWLPPSPTPESEPDETSKKNSPKATYSDQRAGTFVLDGIWNGSGALSDTLTAEVIQKIDLIVRILLDCSKMEDKSAVDLTLLKGFMLVFVEETNVIESSSQKLRAGTWWFETIRNIVMKTPVQQDEFGIFPDEAAKILGRILRIMKPSVLPLLVEHCTKFASQSDDMRKQRENVAKIQALFDRLDETKTGLLSRPKVISLLEEEYLSFPEQVQKSLQNPHLWPIAPLDEAVSHSHSSSVPPGETPTIYDVDDFGVLLEGRVDTLVPIPESVLKETEKGEPQHEHEYVQHMQSEYSSSGSTGVVPIPAPDLPASVAGSSTKSASFAGGSIDMADDFSRSLLGHYRARQTSRRKYSNRPRKLWSVESTPYMESLLTKQQFAALVTNFTGNNEDSVLDDVLGFLQQRYTETSDERISRLRQEQQKARYERRNADFGKAFDYTDVDGKGFVTFEKLIELWKHTKLPIKSSEVQKALLVYQFLTESSSASLDKNGFLDFCTILLEAFDFDLDTGSKLISEELPQSVHFEQRELSRGVLRKAWLEDLQKISNTCGRDRQLISENAIRILEKDAKIHGENKRALVSIALLQRNVVNPYRGRYVMHIVAASDLDARFLCGRVVMQDSGDVAFSVVESGNALHIANVAGNPAILMMNPDRRQISDGSFVCHPLTDAKGRCFGVLNLDTIGNAQLASFAEHELNFHEGVVRVLVDGYFAVLTNGKLSDAVANSLYWFHQRIPSLKSIRAYFIEPDEAQQSPALRRTVSSTGDGGVVVYPHEIVLRKGDPGFLDHLLQAAETAETVRTSVYEQRHMLCPVKNTDQFAVLLLDFSFGASWPEAEEEKSLVNLLAILQKTYDQIVADVFQPSRASLLAYESRFPEKAYEIIFDRLLLTDVLHPLLSAVEASVLSEIRTTSKPPPVYQKLFHAILTIFFSSRSEVGAFDTWNACRDYVRLDLMQDMVDFDPTVEIAPSVRSVITDLHKGFANLHEEDAASAHPLFRFLHRWVMVVFRLLEMTHAASSRKPSAADVQAFVRPPKKPSLVIRKMSSNNKE